MQYLQYGVWTEIYDLIDFTQGITETSRIDDVFQTYTFTAYLEDNQNIPPYTPFIHGNKQWVGTSKITQYLTEEDLYVHEVTLMDPSALLKCFIIGVKVYSKESPTWALDKDKFKSLLTQAKRMYPEYTFNYGNSINNKILTSKTYTFNATATLFDCLNEICVENDVKLKVEFNVNDTTELTIKVNDTISGTYPLFDSRVKIINHTEDQDSENYGKYLETYASNVVDRNTITRCEHLELKADDALLNADTAFIELPTNIELIEEFGVHQKAEESIQIYRLTQYFPSSSVFDNCTTYGDFANIPTTISGKTVYIFEEYYEKVLKRFFPYISKATMYSSVTLDFISYWGQSPNYGLVSFKVPTSCKALLPIMIYEKTEYDVLTPQNQAGYVFYTTGSRKIENLNGYYKNDIWNTLIGESRGNFLSHTTVSNNYYLYDARLQFRYGDTIRGDSDIFHYEYFVLYHPITNPYIRNSKTASSLNEYNWKPFSRSYGVGANSIDFDKIMPNMTISNNTLGQIEKVYEVDLTGENNVDLNDPLAGEAVNFGSGVYWYISSCIRTKKYEKDTAVLTLVKTYQKKADSIGVDTQAETTNNPLHGIVTRPIYLEQQILSQVSIEEMIQWNWCAKFRFYDVDNNLITNTNADSSTISDLYIRCSVQATSDCILLCAEMSDEIIAMFGRGNWSSGFYEQLPFKYTNAKAENGYVEVNVGVMEQASGATEAIFLPVGTNGTFTSKYGFTKIKIDKDAREHLTFSIMLRKN